MIVAVKNSKKANDPIDLRFPKFAAAWSAGKFRPLRQHRLRFICRRQRSAALQLTADAAAGTQGSRSELN